MTPDEQYCKCLDNAEVGELVTVYTDASGNPSEHASPYSSACYPIDLVNGMRALSIKSHFYSLYSMSIRIKSIIKARQ